MNHLRVGRGVAIPVVAWLLISCGGGTSGSPTSPEGPALGAPGGTNISGTWSGALTRPNGSVVTFGWVAKQDSANLRVDGPLTLGLGGTTATGTLWSNIGMAPSGTRQNPVYQMNAPSITVNPGGVAGFPTCQIVSEQAGPVSVTSTTLTFSSFLLRYSNCQGLIAGSGPITESAQLTMTTSPTTAATERWSGVAPDGMIIEPGPGACTLDLDLTLELVPSGTTVTGTAITRERRTAVGCSGLGQVENWSVSRGTLGSGTISFRIGSDVQPIDFTGTFTATRMSGTLLTFGGRRGTFAVNRQ